MGEDKNFSEARNRQIVAETMRETDEFFQKESSLVHDGMMERAHAMACYGTYLFAKHGSKNVDDYLGRHTLTRFLGEKVMERIKAYKTAARLKKIQEDTMHIQL